MRDASPTFGRQATSSVLRDLRRFRSTYGATAGATPGSRESAPRPRLPNRRTASHFLTLGTLRPLRHLERAERHLPHAGVRSNFGHRRPPRRDVPPADRILAGPDPLPARGRLPRLACWRRPSSRSVRRRRAALPPRDRVAPRRAALHRCIHDIWRLPHALLHRRRRYRFTSFSGSLTRTESSTSSNLPSIRDTGTQGDNGSLTPGDKKGQAFRGSVRKETHKKKKGKEKNKREGEEET